MISCESVIATRSERPPHLAAHQNNSTTGCATMHYRSAIGVSIGSAFVFHVSYRVFICFKIDDAINAGAVHFACGFWGLLAAGFTATDAARKDAGYPTGGSCSVGNQLAVNAILALVVFSSVRATGGKVPVYSYVDEIFPNIGEICLACTQYIDMHVFLLRGLDGHLNTHLDWRIWAALLYMHTVYMVSRAIVIKGAVLSVIPQSAKP